MSSAPQAPRDDDEPPTGRTGGTGRRRARVLIPVIFISVIVLIFLFMFLVSRLNQ